MPNEEGKEAGKTKPYDFSQTQIMVGGVATCVIALASTVWGIRRGMRNVQTLDKKLAQKFNRKITKNGLQKTPLKQDSSKVPANKSRHDDWEDDYETGMEGALQQMDPKRQKEALRLARRAFMYGSLLCCGTFFTGLVATSYILDVSTVHLWSFKQIDCFHLPTAVGSNFFFFTFSYKL